MKRNKRARSNRNIKTQSRVARLKRREEGFEARRARNRAASNQAAFVCAPYAVDVQVYRDRSLQEMKKVTRKVARIGSGRLGLAAAMLAAVGLTVDRRQ